MPKELWTEARDIGQEVVIKAIPKEKKKDQELTVAQIMNFLSKIQI